MSHASARKRQPGRNKRRRRKRRKSPVKPLIITASILLAVSAAGVGIFFAVTALKDSFANSSTDNSSSPNNNGSQSDNLFAEPPIDPSITISNENWQPDEKLLSQLGESVRTRDFSIRLAEGMQLRNKLEQDTDNYQFVWERTSRPPYDRRPSRTARKVGDVEIVMVTVFPDDGWTAERMERDQLNMNDRIPAGLPKSRNIKIQRGRLNGRSCYRLYQESQMPGGPVSYGSQYNFVDAKGRLVSCLMLTPAAPGSENFRLLETAARSIQIR